MFPSCAKPGCSTELSLSTHIHLDLGQIYPPEFESFEQAVRPVEIIWKYEAHFQGLELKVVEVSVKPLNSSPNCRGRMWGREGEVTPFFLSKLKAHLQEHIGGALIGMWALGSTENPTKQPPAKLKFKLLCFAPTNKSQPDRFQRQKTWNIPYKKVS